MEALPKRILAVDDDAEFLTLIVETLEQDGYDVVACHGGPEALEALRDARFDLVLADIRMPRMSGTELLWHVRRIAPDTEVILMTAYATVQTAVEAVRGEAFDYLVKPFSLRELRRRVNQATRGRPSRELRHRQGSHDDLLVDLSSRRVWADGREIRVTRREFDLLAYLFEHQGHAVSVRDLLLHVWGSSADDTRSLYTVKSCVCRVRRKIGDDARRPRHILSVWGVGYQLGD